jgi:hypothetical protein
MVADILSSRIRSAVRAWEIDLWGCKESSTIPERRGHFPSSSLLASAKPPNLPFRTLHNPDGVCRTRFDPVVPSFPGATLPVHVTLVFRKACQHYIDTTY